MINNTSASHIAGYREAQVADSGRSRRDEIAGLLNPILDSREEEQQEFDECEEEVNLYGSEEEDDEYGEENLITSRNEEDGEAEEESEEDPSEGQGNEEGRLFDTEEEDLECYFRSVSQDNGRHRARTAPLRPLEYIEHFKLSSKF